VREKVCRELGGCARFAFGFSVRSVGTRVRTGGLRGVGGGRPAAGRRAQDAGRRTHDAGRSETGDPRRWDALDPGFHGVPREPVPGAGRGRVGGGGYGMMWEKGGVWGLGVI